MGYKKDIGGLQMRIRISKKTSKVIYAVEILAYAGIGYVFRNNLVGVSIVVACFLLESYAFYKKALKN